MARAFRSRVPAAKLVNLFGPTEAAVYTMSATLDEVADVVPIGRPMPNTTAWVLDGRLHPVPDGVSGELYLGGVQSARGYAARPDLTADRFVADPFGASGARMYRTGDVVRRNRSGDLEYLGRTDFQVKLRGQRMELGEVESAMAAVSGVVHAAAAVVAGPAGDQLVGYLAPAGVDAARVEAELARTLPEYMVPTVWVLLETMPLNSAGKVDRRALPEPEIEAAEYVAPQSAAEERVAEVFASLLGVDRVSVVDSFFALGGNSLAAMRLVARAGAALGVDLSVRDVFDAPSVRALAASSIGKARALAPIIAVTPRPERIPLSFAQQRMWFINQLDPTLPTYNIPAVIRLTGDLDVAALRTAVGDAVRRQEVLRTTFPAPDGMPWQAVADESTVDASLPWVEATSLAEFEAAVRAGFDVTVDWPIRVVIHRSGADDFLFAVVTHHIAADGESMLPLVTDILTAYAARSEGAAPAFAPLAVQFADFAIWQHEVLGSPDDPESVVGRQLAFWRQYLSGSPDVLELPADRPRPAVASYAGDRVPFAIPARTADRVARLSREAGTTPFMVVHAALAVLLARLSGTDDVTVVTPTAGRGHAELDRLVGMFVNTLVLRARVDVGESFADLLAKVRTADLEALANADAPFETVVEALDPVRSEAFAPLAQVMLTFDTAASVGKAEVPVGGVVAEPIDPGISPAQVDLTFAVDTAPEGADWPGSIVYATDLFDRSSAAAFARRFVLLLDELTGDTGRAVGAHSMFDDGERTAILAAATGPVDLTPPVSVADEVARRVVETPSATALLVEDRDITYAEFGARVATLARELIAAGVGPDVPVAVCMDRGVESVVAIHAVVAAGGQYVPIAVDLPADRAAYMVTTAGVELVLVTAGTTPEPIAGLDEVRTIGVDASRGVDPAAPPVSDAERLAPLRPEHALYTLFTSGSTGVPKGVTVSNAAALNRLRWGLEAFPWSPGDRVMLKTPYTFDVSVPELFGPLIAGATVVVARAGAHRDPAYLAELIAARQVTSVHFVPSMLAVFLDVVDRDVLADLRSLKWLFASGEALPPALVSTAHEIWPDVGIHNLFGPTEAGVEVGWADVSEAPELVTIGTPVRNCSMLVLDPRLNPVPVGVPGELYLGGVQLARGYAARTQLTSERFVADPYGGPGARMYRTGDLVRRLPSGDIEYLGRTDFQVKLRGQRIELGEIESVIVDAPGVVHAAATVTAAPAGGDFLVGYVAPASVDLEAVKAHVAAVLPEYMRPSAWMRLGEAPLNSAGKLDRRALPAVDFTELRKEYVEPVGETERLVAAAFADVLGLDEVSAEESFFEAGGTSLAAVRVVAQLRETLGGDVELAAVFHDPTPRKLAAALDAGSSQSQVVLPLRRTGVHAPLFCIHPAGGLAWFYGGMAPYLSDRPIYGVQDPHVVAGDEIETDADRLAARYIDEIRRVQPSGPYHLLGWSVGGVIAHAMATTLCAAGEDVAYLGMMDSAVPDRDVVDGEQKVVGDQAGPGDAGPEEAAVDSAVDLLGSWRDLFDIDASITAGDADSVVEIVREQIAGMGLLSQDQVERIMESFDSSGKLVRDFVPRDFDGDLHVFVATEDKDDPDAVAASWRPFVAGAVTVTEVPTHHLGMANAEALELIGPALDAQLLAASGMPDMTESKVD
ncbi:MAG: amino acid adenylation domain-containing protein [Gordonia sp. (in: high G+C Gram-positive bacteria)]